MKIEELKQGLERILDAANEKLNALCEQVGIEPDDPALTEENDAETEEEGGGEGGSEGENGSSNGDENTIPTPENLEGGEGIPQNGADMAAAQAGMEGGAAPAMEIPPEAQQMVGAEGGAMPPPGGEQPVPQGGGEMSPDEEELMRQQAAQSQQ